MFKCTSCNKLMKDEDCNGCDQNCQGKNLKRVATIHYLRKNESRSQPVHHQSQYGKFFISCKESDPSAKLPPFFSTAIPAVTCEACLQALEPKPEVEQSGPVQ